jgi:hypothetical protein
MQISPLSLERAKHYIETAPNDDKTKNFSIVLLSAIIKDPQASFIVCPTFRDIILYLSEYCPNDAEIFRLIENFQIELQNVLLKFGVESVDNITQDFVSAHYDNLINDVNFENIENDHDKKLIAYKTIYNLINERDLLLWSITDDLQYIQYDIAGSLYAINPDLLVYYNDDKLKLLRNALIYKWGCSLVLTQWQYTLQRCNSIIQSYENNSIASRSCSVSNINLVSALNASKVNQLSESESNAYWEIRWLNLFALFLIGDYESVVSNFVDLTTNERSIQGVQSDSLVGLEKFNTSVIDKKSLLRVITISIILTQNNQGRNTFWKNNILIDTFYDDQVLRRFKNTFESIEFPELTERLYEMEEEFLWCEQLNTAFEKVESLLIQKSVLTYLSLINRISFKEISEFFSIKKEKLMEFVNKTTVILDLPLYINEELQLIEYTRRSNNKENQFIDKVHNQIEDEIIRVKINKLNSIINLSNETENENENENEHENDENL